MWIVIGVTPPTRQGRKLFMKKNGLRPQLRPDLVNAGVSAARAGYNSAATICFHSASNPPVVALRLACPYQ